jgi:phage anti-repressor protein
MTKNIKLDSVDFNALIKNSTTLTLNTQSKMVEILNEEFTQEESRWYIANLYVYMNYHPTNDYPINLDTLVKLVGFAHKKNAKATLENNFIKDEDYKILLTPKGKQVKINGGAGLNKEQIMLNTDTFKNMCMLVKTEKSKQIRKYYVKLENIYNRIITEEIEEQENRLQVLQSENKEQQQRIELLEHKPNTHGFNSRRAGYVYMINDRSKPGHYKIGMSYDVDKRLTKLNTASSEATLQIYKEVKTYDCETLENTVHKILQPFNIPRRREWFFFSNDTELQYALKILQETQMFLNKFNFESSDDITEYLTNNATTQTQPKQEQVKQVIKYLTNNATTQTQQEQVKQEQVKQEQDTQEQFKVEQEQFKVEQDTQENITETNVYKLTGQQLKNKTGNYKGVFWCTEKSKWRASLKVHYKEHFLGYFDNELSGAIVYNDYAVYLNNTRKTNYVINNIPNYLPNPRDILKENLLKQIEIGSSKYVGVSYDSNRKYYVVSIKYKRKTYHLGHNNDELECAKLYNQQALYFNNTFSSDYILNDIPEYITLPVNIYELLQTKKTSKKSSKYLGVCLNKQTGKYKSIVVYNKKQIHIGTFTDEIQAAQAYNKRVSELNDKFNTNYKLNEITD